MKPLVIFGSIIFGSYLIGVTKQKLKEAVKVGPPNEIRADFNRDPIFESAQHGQYLTAPFGPGGTWNLYQAWTIPETWMQAQTRSETTVDPLGKSGKMGHLVTISSAAENMFAHGNSFFGNAWIGLTDQEKWGGKNAGANRQGGWRWVTGEPITYQAWLSTEPNQNNGRASGVVAAFEGRWATVGVGVGQIGPHGALNPSMTEWEVHSPTPVEGATAIRPIFPEKWPVDLANWKGASTGSGPWLVHSVVGPVASNLPLTIDNLVKSLKPEAPFTKVPRLNYRLFAGQTPCAGWVAITDQPTFKFESNSSALHVATVHLKKAATWSFCLHCDDFSAIRFPGRSWKSAHGSGGIDPLDPATLYYSCVAGDGDMIGTIDLPAGDSTVEVVLGNPGWDGLVQLITAPGDVAIEGGSDAWRFPGYKAKEDLAWPGIDSSGWTFTRSEVAAEAFPKNLQEALAIADAANSKSFPGVPSLNLTDPDAPGDVNFPNPTPFPGDVPGKQDRFILKASANLVIPRDGIYHLGIIAPHSCAFRVKGANWQGIVRSNSFNARGGGDTIYVDGGGRSECRTGLVGEIKLAKGSYPVEILSVDAQPPSALSVFGGPANFAPRLLTTNGAKIEPDQDGLPLLEPSEK